MKLYNTLTRKKEEFEPINGKKVGFYSCGPTVYDYPHIGNLRAYIFADTLKRCLEYNDYIVKHVVNITDVGHLVSDEDEGIDKIEKGAEREKKSAYEIAEKYTKAFMKDLTSLNIEKADDYPKATEHIKEQLDLIKVLEEKGFTYTTSDGVYFDTSKLTDYGKLAGLDIEGLRAGARVEHNPEKKNTTDFALWKFSPKGSKREMEWDSPWGVGFPGWHIECSAMSRTYLGDYFDIHSGGIDHIPVHHTNEIAQSEAAFDKPFVKYWVHSDFLLVDGRKMSKSLNNFYTLADLKEQFGADPLDFRMLCLGAHYREKMNFTENSIVQAKNSLAGIRDFIWRIGSLAKSDMPENSTVGKLVAEAKEKFENAMSDDLNTPMALAAIFSLIKEVNTQIVQGISNSDAKSVTAFLAYCDKVLGLGLIPDTDAKIPEKIESLIEEREKARTEKDWQASDTLRDHITALGYEVEDTKGGQLLRKL